MHLKCHWHWHNQASSLESEWTFSDRANLALFLSHPYTVLNVCPTTDILSLLYSVSVLITKSIVFFTALWKWPLEKFLYSRHYHVCVMLKKKKEKVFVGRV
jgi:hypothetical protein